MAVNGNQAGDPIRHVVLLILENRSFDQMLGCFKQVRADVDGIDRARPGQNEVHGETYRQAPTTERMMFLDPHHEMDHVARQLADHNGGFVRDFAGAYPDSTPAERALIMSYYPLDFLPALHALARDFTICDRWFSSLPGPTWPNRCFALTGTSNGRVNMPDDGRHTVDAAGWFEQNQATLFDRLNDRGIDWKVYFHDIPQTSVLLHQRLPHNAARYFYMDEFFDDARGREDEFPQFCLIEPDYLGAGESDDHPPHDVMKAEKLIADVYNAIRANRQLWESTLLVVFFDEHGGFYDHVEPPGAKPPDDHREEYTFDRYGVRVPALLVSPWAGRRVKHTQFDHTSVLKYLIDKWQLGPLGDRTAAAASIGVALQSARRDDRDTIGRIELTQEQLAPVDLEREEATWGVETSHHRALAAMKHWLTVRAVDGIPRLYAWTARVLEFIKAHSERLLAHLYGDLRISLIELDKLARKKVDLKDDFARFLMNQKRQAVAATAARIHDERLPPAVRAHAVHTLALVSKRPFHKTHDRVGSASAWLRRRGYR